MSGIVRMVIAAMLGTTLGAALQQPVAAQAEVPGLTGITWQWIGLASPAGDLRVDAPDRYTLLLGGDGKVVLRADCNRGAGNWQREGAQGLSFGTIALTRAMCPPGSLSDRFVAELGHAAGWELKDGELIIELSTAASLRFRKQP